MIEIREALSSESPTLQHLQQNCPMGSDLKVSMQNTPDFFSRCRNYSNYTVFVATKDGRLIGSIAAALKTIYINGELKKAGYLFQLFVEENSRKTGVAIRLCRIAEKWLKSNRASLIYCLIMHSNEKTRKVMAGLGYEVTRQVTIRYLPCFKSVSFTIPLSLSLESLKEKDYSLFADFLNQAYGDANFYSPLDEQQVKTLLRGPGFSEDLSFLLKDKKNNTIQAAILIWDWHSVSKVKVVSMSQNFRWLKCLTDTMGKFIPSPYIAGPGASLKQWGIQYLGALNPLLQQLAFKIAKNEAFQKKIDQICFVGDPNMELFKISKSIFSADVHETLQIKWLEGKQNMEGQIFVSVVDL